MQVVKYTLFNRKHTFQTKLLMPSMSPIREGETSEEEVKFGANFSFHLGLVKGFCFRFASLLGIGQADIEREETAGQGEKFVFAPPQDLRKV